MKTALPCCLAGLWLVLQMSAQVAMAAPTAASRAEARASRVLDDLRQPAAWKASASDQVRANLRRTADGGLCLDADFGGVSGYAVMRRELPIDWPAHFNLTARVQGGGALNDVQLKFVDASGDNVWWVNRPNTRPPARWADWQFQRRHIGFAWGPTAQRELRQTAAVELVLAAGREGGRSSLCLQRLGLAERAPDPATWPAPVVHQRGGTQTLDLGLPRDFNGLSLQWPSTAANAPRHYQLQASDDGRHWRTLRTVQGALGQQDRWFLPEQRARWLRLRWTGPRPTGWPTWNLVDAATWPDANAAQAHRAAALPRGDVPRAFVGEQNYWTLVGVDGGGERSALLSEDGAVELGRGGPSVEPVLQVADAAGQPATTLTWAQVQASHLLPEGHLPLPQVRWRHPLAELQVQAAADGPLAAPRLLARYTVHNPTAQARHYTLAWVLRPWQVNPPQQFLTTPGGLRPVGRLAWSAGALEVDGRVALQPVPAPVPLASPLRVSALPGDAGAALAPLLAAPTLRRLHDPQAQASAALQQGFTLAPGASLTLAWVAPLGDGPAVVPADAAALDAAFDAVAATWRERLGRVGLDLPGPEGQRLVHSLRSALAHMLMSRSGPWLRPGTRSYHRTWVRDGAMMVAGLLRLGEVAAAREFVDAFAPRIFESGKVPCCVDARGADPVAENDSHGQYLFAVAEVLRHTGDTHFARQHWPWVQRVLAYQEGLRQSERTAANQVPGRLHLFGLMPPSISHEGYSDKPAYSYWDNFWVLRGYKDAVHIAQALGQVDEARRWAAWRDEFTVELQRSVAATAAFHRVDFIAGAADRGDFDATSTTMALNPAQASLPPGLLDATFERYWQEARSRGAGERVWKDYTPYELRTVGALVRLGRPDRAHALLDFFFGDQRPAGWNQWAEVVLPRDSAYRRPQFLGDMPHAWVSSDYVRSALDLLAYDREADQALVLGAGWAPAWLQQGLAVRGLPTAHGRLDLRLERLPRGWRLELSALQPTAAARPGAPVQRRLAWPLQGPLPMASHQGQVLHWVGRELPLPEGALTLWLAETGAKAEAQPEASAMPAAAAPRP